MKFILSSALIASVVSAGRLGGKEPTAASISTPSAASPSAASSFAQLMEKKHRQRKLLQPEECAPCVEDDKTIIEPLPILTLSSANVNIDGIISNGPYSMSGWGNIADGTEYDGFLTIPMFNGGKNNDGSTPQIATAQVGYDCSTKTFCVAAYYTKEYLLGMNGEEACGLDESVDNSWTSFEQNKLNEGNALAFQYLKITDFETEGDSFTVGYEGCWKLDDFDKLDPAKFLDLIDCDLPFEVHFNRNCDGGLTTSTGKGRNGKAYRLCGQCPFDPDTECEDEPSTLSPCYKWDCTSEVPDPDQENMACTPDDGTVPDSCKNYACSASGNCIVASEKPNGETCTMGDGTDATCCMGACGGSGCDPDVCEACDTAPEFVGDAPTNVDGSNAFTGCSLDIGDTTRGVTFCDGSSTTTTAEMTSSPMDGGVCGEYIYRWSATDCHGQTSTSEVTYTLNKNDPTLNVPANYDGSCTDTDFGSADASNDCNDALSPTYTDDDNEEDCKTTTTRTWTVEDDCGNVVSQAQTIVLTDISPATLSLPLDYTKECSGSAGLEAVPITMDITGSPETSDDCSLQVSLSSSDAVDSSSNACQHVVTRTYSAHDGCNEPTTGDQTITIQDTTAPTLTDVPADVTLSCGPDLDLTETTTGSAPSGSDDCSSDATVTVTSSDSDPVLDGCADRYAITRTFTATDECGLTSEATQLISVVDNAPPTLSVPSARDYQCGEDAPAFGPATGEDVCSTTVTIGSTDHVDTKTSCGADKILEVTTRTWTATDECGNQAMANETITKIDTTNPTVVPPANVNYQCGTDFPTNLEPATGADTCSSVDISFADSAVVSTPSCENGILETTTRTWTATDECGNEASNTQLISKIDNVVPTIVVPANIDLECAGPAMELGVATATDTCDSDVAISSSEDLETKTQCEDQVLSVLTKTWTAEDDCGNTAGGDQIIKTVDTTAPELHMPGAATLECGASDYSTDPIATGEATGSDTCSANVDVTYSDVPTNPPTCENNLVSSLTRTWTATDECLNSKSLPQTIETKDTLAPALSDGPGATKEYLCSDPCVNGGAPPSTAECAGLPPIATDQCQPDVAVVVSDAAATTDMPPGVTYTREFTATDACGNYATQVQTINVVDDCSFEVSDAFSGLSIVVDISIVNVEGGVAITATVDDPALTGDLRGVFFQVGDASAITDITGDETTLWKADNGGVDRLAKDVLMKGGGKNMPTYNVGVALGTSGKKWDDIQSSTFTVLGITTDDIDDSAYFGVRLTSVGEEDSGRQESSKVYGPATCCRYEPPV